ncbi:beclin-1 [Magnaporthiopsis poae ATCC 64411]|uniref:Beclin-1 n=1 Tax=Magnaporthiopsis poae (strain ATCC 64411 / 73-15) TaxID=644358 RepID=A0A0C4E3R0_MAGP6|nr:beclin-1 [Magnaporthiopsis poae ATCC 64411]
MYCQKCRTPLKLDGSLQDLNPAAYDLLVTTSSQQSHAKLPESLSSPSPSSPRSQSRLAAYKEAAAQNAGPPTFKRYSGGQAARADKAGVRDNSMSFILLEGSQIAPSSSRRPSSKGSTTAGADAAAKPAEDELDPSPSREMGRMTRLFEVLSARSDIVRDHLSTPGNISTLQLCRSVILIWYCLSHRSDSVLPGTVHTWADLVPTDETYLRPYDAETSPIVPELVTRRLDADEEQFWRERNAFASRLAEFQNERDSINSRYDNDARLYQSLQRTNVYNDTFLISHDGTFATINGLRLGRLHASPVDWPEINAAWGHALLLVSTVAEKLQYRFDGYEPQPMGSTSRIIRYEVASPSSSSRLAGAGVGAGVVGPPPPAPRKHVLELFSSGGDMPLLPFMHRRLDAAMVAFLELVRQLGAFVERQTAAQGRPLDLPYRIEGDRIQGVSIKLGIAQDDAWTKACKLTLTCCKFLLAHASSL